MSRLLVVALCALVLAGCQPDNSGRIRAYKECLDAGMTPLANTFNDIFCTPPAKIAPTCNCEEAVRAALAEIENYKRESAQEKGRE